MEKIFLSHTYRGRLCACLAVTVSRSVLYRVIWFSGQWMNEWLLTKRKNFRHSSGLWQWHGRITAFYYPSCIQNSNLNAVLFLKNPLFCPLYLGRLSYYLPVYSESICTPRKYEFCVHFTWMHQHFVRADSPFSGGVNRMKVLNQKHKHRFQWTSTISRAKSPAAYYFEKFTQNRSAKYIYLFIHSFFCK